MPKPNWARIPKFLYWVPPVLVFQSHVATVQHVGGHSMQPTFNPDTSLKSDLVLLDRLSASPLFVWYGEHFNMWRPEFKRGDVVVLKSPINPRHRIIKRIIALPDDVVQTLPPYPQKTVQVPGGHIWVEGDEPFKTKDSNTFGPASLGLVEAKVKYILWPLERFGPVPSTPPDTSLLSRIMPAPPHIKDINELMRAQKRASRVRTRQESESTSDAE
ncbi:hypothetical protein FRB93_005509 [Tulasnella sp. JGI-2019a]|nr:hypothetical protein FRB93_005509 [Tulasnella sp. JGI-2019a]